MSNENAPSPPVGKKHAPRGRIKAHPMSITDPMSAHVGGDTLHGRQRCSARSKQKGTRCGRTAIDGGTVCRYHGGAAPQVIQKAEERLMALHYPAVVRLEELMQQTEFPSVAIAAVKDALDRIRGKAIEQQILEHKGGITITWDDGDDEE